MIKLDNFQYIVLIDESGDPAYDKLADRAGNRGDFFNLGAAFIKIQDYEKTSVCLDNIRKNLNTKSLHFTELKSHYKKLYAITEINLLDFVAFSVVSNKRTLKEGMNVVYNPSSPIKFYHKNLCFLFERLNKYIKENKIDKNKIQFIIEKNNCVGKLLE